MRLDNMNRFRSVAMVMAIISSGTLCAQTEQPDILSESVDGSRGHFVYAALGYGNITSRIEGNWDSGNAHSGFDWQLGYSGLEGNGVAIICFNLGFVCHL